jgi:hypothetical protein
LPKIFWCILRNSYNQGILWIDGLVGKIIVNHLERNLTAFYGTGIFITAHNIQPLICTLPRINSVYAHVSYFFKIHFNITFPFTQGFTSCLCVVLQFLTKILYATFLSPIRATCLTLIIFLDFTTWQFLGNQQRSWSSLILSTGLTKMNILSRYKCKESRCERVIVITDRSVRPFA